MILRTCLCIASSWSICVFVSKWFQTKLGPHIPVQAWLTWCRNVATGLGGHPHAWVVLENRVFELSWTLWPRHVTSTENLRPRWCPAIFLSWRVGRDLRGNEGVVGNIRIGMWLGNSQYNFKLHGFTMSEIYQIVFFRGYLFTHTFTG